MREIKFRCFDKLRNEMYWPTSLHCDYKGKSPFKSIRFTGDSPDDSIIMQYTGLKDKSGKEIYEGDIVLIEGCKQVIEWSVSNSEHQGHGECTTDTFVGFSLGFWGRSKNRFNECEVIGNIHENPNLLDTKTS